MKTLLTVLVVVFAYHAAAQMIPRDKQEHIAAGFVISGLAVSSKEIKHPMATAIFVSALAGVAKEAYDNYGHGTVDAKDVLATVTGGVISGTIAYAFKKKRERKKREYQRHRWQHQQYFRY